MIFLKVKQNDDLKCEWCFRIYWTQM
jgi:hypothetical protein